MGVVGRGDLVVVVGMADLVVEVSLGMEVLVGVVVGLEAEAVKGMRVLEVVVG